MSNLNLKDPYHDPIWMEDGKGRPVRLAPICEHLGEMKFDIDESFKSIRLLDDDLDELKGKINGELYKHIDNHVSRIYQCIDSKQDNLFGLTINFNIETREMICNDIDYTNPSTGIRGKNNGSMP